MKITSLHSNHHYSSDPTHPSWWGDDDEGIRDSYHPWDYRSIGHWMSGGEYWYPGAWADGIRSNHSIVDGNEIHVTIMQSLLSKHFKNRPKKKVKIGSPSAARSSRSRLLGSGDNNFIRIWNEDGCV